MPLMRKMPWNVIQERDSRYIVPRNDAPPLRHFAGSKRTKGKTEGEKRMEDRDTWIIIRRSMGN